MSEQTHLFTEDSEATRTLLDQLLTDSRLYTKSNNYAELLAFVAKLRNFAPFNAMLLQVQNPQRPCQTSCSGRLSRHGHT